MKKLSVSMMLLLSLMTSNVYGVEFDLGKPTIEVCEKALNACDELVEAQDKLIEQQKKELEVVRTQVQEVEERSKWSWVLMGIVGVASLVGGVLLGSII